MKKSMRMVSVLMSAVMAMSALAAGASAADFHGPKHNPKTSYTESFDRLSSEAVPVVVKTDGINGRVKDFKVTMDYEFVAKADSSIVKEISAKHPEYFVSFPDIDGNVVVHVNEKHTYTADTSENFYVPANTDMKGMTITVSYDACIWGEKIVCKRNLSSSHIDETVKQILIDLDATGWVIGYTVSSKIFVNNNLIGEDRAYSGRD